MSATPVWNHILGLRESTALPLSIWMEVLQF